MKIIFAKVTVFYTFNKTIRQRKIKNHKNNKLLSKTLYENVCIEQHPLLFKIKLNSNNPGSPHQGVHLSM